MKPNISSVNKPPGQQMSVPSQQYSQVPMQQYQQMPMPQQQYAQMPMQYQQMQYQQMPMPMQMGGYPGNFMMGPSEVAGVNLIGKDDKEYMNKKTVAIIVSICNGSTYDGLFTTTQQKSAEGTKTMVFSASAHSTKMLI